jgi:hypothetical protein
MKEEPVTVERLERCIQIVAYGIVRHNLPQALPTLKRLEAERDRLQRLQGEGDPIEYARRVLECGKGNAAKGVPDAAAAEVPRAQQPSNTMSNTSRDGLPEK